jgi:hypothetical protein
VALPLDDRAQATRVVERDAKVQRPGVDFHPRLEEPQRVGGRRDALDGLQTPEARGRAGYSRRDAIPVKPPEHLDIVGEKPDAVDERGGFVRAEDGGTP